MVDTAETDAADLARATAIGHLKRAAETRKRKATVPFHPSTVLAGATGGTPPLARLIQGGRGGEVRLKVYLTAVMMAVGGPNYDVRRSPPPGHWAEMLQLDPRTGPRRVSNSLRWLDRNNYLRLDRQNNGLPPRLLLLNPRDGSEYTAARYNRDEGRYLGVPLGFWTEGWILDLSARAIALLFCLLDLQSGHTRPRYVTADRKGRYGLSNDTWTRATDDLEDAGLLTVDRIPQGSAVDYPRMRNTYDINRAALRTREVLDQPDNLINFDSPRTP